MVQRTPQALAELYETDETAWLDAMAELVAHRQFDELDTVNLAEYLDSMARRDRREVKSRLIVLMLHLLKWDYQPTKRGESWVHLILEQKRELRELLESGTLHNYAESILNDAFDDACKEAMIETQLPRSTFPATSNFTVEMLLADWISP